MSLTTDLRLAYHMGYDDALARRKPDASKAQVLAPYDLAAENAKLRVLCRDMYLVVELLDMDGMRLQAHGKDADWRTLKERFEELMGIEVEDGD